MTAFPYIPVPSTGFLALRTRPDIEDSPMQKIKIYRQKLKLANLCFRSLAFRVGNKFLLCFMGHYRNLLKISILLRINTFSYL